MNLRRLGTSLIAPAIGIFISIAVTAVILKFIGASVTTVFSSMWTYGTSPHAMSLTLNLATTYFLSALAVAVGFKMNLFNIGVNGQYVLGALAAAVVGSNLHMVGFIAIPISIMAAMIVGAAWAGIAAWLKVSRGVSEVISTIMLNFIAIGIISYIIVRTGIGTETSLNVRGTKLIPESGMLHGTAFLDPGTKVYGFFFISIFIAISYWFLLNRTRFGFDLRATGKSATAARTSGVESKRMAIVTMLLSGAIAGLVGLPYLLGETGSYNLNFPTDWGFTGIAIALLGRNNPLGIALGALLWAFLDISSGQLILEGVPREITTIMQGLIVIVVVMSYEIVRRNQVKSEQKNVAKALAKQEVAA
ncbi:MAG: ABC transporter permease [Actinomycetes bacterium]